MIAGLDHVQVAAPPGGENAARAFYAELLGLPEIVKPERLRARGGVWFQCGDHQLHVGVEEPFAPARKAHPALAVPRTAELAVLAERLQAAGRPVAWDGPRIYTEDPFGNRLELLAPHAEVVVRALAEDERPWAALPALRLYQRHGFRLTALRPGALDAARARKPQIPAAGHAGIPIRDELELERGL
ncbi:MAG: hypothetical protein QOJ82_3649 [Solirubrobacteraceae bacterium]|nr:hypothetical protein [Solirubrobacteraceae bacterium]